MKTIMNKFILLIKRYKEVVLILFISLIIPPLLMVKTKYGFLSDDETAILMGYFGSVLGGITTLLVVFLTIKINYKHQRPVIKMEQIEIIKKPKDVLRDIVGYIGCEKEYQSNHIKDYSAVLSFYLNNKGNNDAVDVTTKLKRNSESIYDVHSDNEAYNSEILVRNDWLYCTLIVSNRVVKNTKICFDFIVNYKDALLNEYEETYSIELTNNRSVKLEKISIISKK